jgi:hypothetical protein
MSQNMSIPRHLAQVQFANNNPWWNTGIEAEKFHHKDDVHVSRGQMTRSLPSLSQTENDEEYFD